MPVAIVTIVATLWALARSSEFELKAAKATRKFGAGTTSMTIEDAETEPTQPAGLQSSSEPRPTLERRVSPIPIAASDTN